jgi:hypothetical protein
MMRRRLVWVGAVVAGTVMGLTPAMAQQQQPPPPLGVPGNAQGPPPDPGPLTAGQIQRWFEAYTVLQAQDALRLSEAQYGRFVTRLKLLQEARRRHQQSRNQILADLRRMTSPQAAAADDPQLAERVKALRDEDERAAAEMKKGYEGVDETLDLRQQARFRVFEERMEQQKLELLMRARQNARGRGRGGSS